MIRVVVLEKWEKEAKKTCRPKFSGGLRGFPAPTAKGRRTILRVQKPPTPGGKTKNKADRGFWKQQTHTRGGGKQENGAERRITDNKELSSFCFKGTKKKRQPKANVENHAGVDRTAQKKAKGKAQWGITGEGGFKATLGVQSRSGEKKAEGQHATVG